MSGSTLSVCLFSFVVTAIAMLVSSCGDGGGGSVAENRSNRGYNPGVGPFDSRGNYVEKWADDKSKGRWWRSSTSKPTAVAKTTPDVAPPVVASNVTPRPAPSSAAKPRPRPPVGRAPVTSPSRKPTVASRPKPKPRPAARTKPKSKPPIRHTIKKGDTLYALSRKYGTSVTAIQRANGLKGTNLRIGRRLLIPRY